MRKHLWRIRGAKTERNYRGRRSKAHVLRCDHAADTVFFASYWRHY